MKAEMSESKDCACGSGETFQHCCAPYIVGTKQPETAERLLRSRYTAFSKHQVDYILSTHHPEKAKEVTREAIDQWSRQSKWLGLTVIKGERGGEADEDGEIEFIARYQQDGKVHDHHEVSLFKKHEGKWYFFDVTKYRQEPIRRVEPKTGRNDPCPCGSGKKYKKCCAEAA